MSEATTSPASTVTVIVVHHGTPEALEQCLAGLAADGTGAARLEVFVVDNPLEGAEQARSERLLSDLETRAWPFARLSVLRNGANVGFGAACNRAAGQTRTTALLLLNPDAQIGADVALELADHLETRPECGAVGCRIVADDGVAEPTWSPELGLATEVRRRRFWKAWEERRSSAVERAEAQQRSDLEGVPWLTAACLCVRRRAFEEVQGFDEGFFLYFEDADLCLRLRRRNWRIDYRADLSCRHRRGLTSGLHPDLRTIRRASQRRYYGRWRPLWERVVLRLLQLIR